MSKIHFAFWVGAINLAGSDFERQIFPHVCELTNE
jgi:hypothetical protein